MNNCEICNDIAVETHHINEQKNANINGFIGHFHKNNKHNLVPLCKKCHNDTTYGNLIINGYIQTSNGIILHYYYDDIKKSKKKFNDEQINYIKSFKSTYDINVNNCIMLLNKNNIEISKNTLKKIMNDEY